MDVASGTCIRAGAGPRSPGGVCEAERAGWPICAERSCLVAASAVMTRRLSLSWLVPAGVLVAALLLFGPDIALWWRVWRDPDSFYAHGPVVPVLAGLLIWIDWKRIKRVVPQP